MLFWSRTGNLTDFVGFLFLCLLWGIGGWLIVRHAFHLKSREKLITGLATGFILFIVLSNLLAHVLPLTAAFWASGVILLLVGLGLTWRSAEPSPFKTSELRLWPWMAILALVTLFFTMVLTGLAIFDDYYHLPLISVMATGDIPPHFYLDPPLHLPYHYGLQVFAAGLVRLGGFFPWSGWDVSRAIVLGLTPLLGWLWVRRMTNSNLAAGLGALLFFFGAGSRWLLLLIPKPFLIRLGANLHMSATGVTAGGNLLTDLMAPFPMNGGAPIPFPFAFANGLLEPLNMNLGASGALWEMTILTLLLLSMRRRSSPIGTLALSLVIASLALSAEHVYALLVIGIGCAVLLSAAVRLARGIPIRRTFFTPWGVPLTISLVLALFQGGYITDGFRSLFARLTGGEYQLLATDYQAFSFRWPLAVPTGHLGPLSLFDPLQIIILLAEAGPALVLIPVLILCWRKRLNRNNRLPQGLAIGALLSFTFPIFIRYGLDFDITRMVGAALWLFYVLAFPIVWRWLTHTNQAFRSLASLGYGIAVYAGLVMLAVEFVAIANPQVTYYINYKETTFSRKYWDRLEKNAQILDSSPERAITLFGRASFAATDIYVRSPRWEAFVANPDPALIAQAGYAYVYMDEGWWQKLTTQQQARFNQPCVHLVDKINFAERSFRNLYSVKACEP